MVPEQTPKEKFTDLAEKWRREISGSSFPIQKIKNKNYQQIIMMGDVVIPFIFESLQKEPEYWFAALDILIAPEGDPIFPEHYGNLDQMAEDWLEFGRTMGYIKDKNAENRHK